MTRKIMTVAALALFALLLDGSGVQARVLIKETFEEAAFSQPPGGPSISRVADFTGVTRGAFSFDLRRTASLPAGEWETVFEIVDDNDRRVLRMKVNWSTGADPEGPAFLFQGGHRKQYRYLRRGLGLWGPVVVLDRPVAVGETIRVDLTWDDASRSYGVYVDGREVERSFGGVDPLRKRWAPDQRARINLERKRSGKTVYFESSPMGEILSHGISLFLGYYDSPWPMPPFGSPTPLRGSALRGFTVYVDEVPPPGSDPPVKEVPAASITAVFHDAAGAGGFSGKLVAGDEVTVSLEGSPGGSASFDVALLASPMGEIAVDWRGFGVYLDEEKIFFDEDEIDLREVEEYRVYVGTEPIVNPDGETVPAEILERDEQSCVVDGLEPDVPYYVSVAALMDDGTFAPVIEPLRGIAMSEDEGAPGTYGGTFTVGYDDRFPEGVIVGHLRSGDTAAALAGDEVFGADASLTLQVAASPGELKADEESTSEITVTVTDANGEPVPDHAIRFLLATTSQYTGVVGGGAFSDETGGTMGRDMTGETDLFGQVMMTYTAGFAAKTAIIVARDMVSGDTGAGYVRTWISAAAELQLEAVQETMGKALGYSITVTSSDEWLTADGESEARITALVTKDGAPVEGHRVGFSVSSGAGTIRTVRGETDEDGEARAVYTAGKKIGMVLITAVDHSVGITGSVQIELRSDAPAKIGAVVTPDVLPADGRSTADVLVVVTDINDNPNEGVEVEYRVAIGSGRLRDIDGTTDDDGESTAEYVAGRIPGKVSIEVTVRSTVPTAQELAAARELAVSVPDYDFF